MAEDTNKIWSFFKNHWKDLLLIIGIIVIIILIMSTTCTRQENKNLSNNIKALLDSVKVVNLKNGELMYEKQSLILNKKELEEYLDISKKEVKDLEKQLDASLALIAKLQGQVRIDTLIMTDSIYISQNNDTIQSFFKYNDKWLNIDGNTLVIKDFSKTTLNNISMDVPLKLALSDNYRIAVTTANPYVSFSEIDAAAIEGSVVKEKKKRWNVGAQLGFGGGYNLLGKENKFFIGPYIGVGISYGFDF